MKHKETIYLLFRPKSQVLSWDRSQGSTGDLTQDLISGAFEDSTTKPQVKESLGETPAPSTSMIEQPPASFETAKRRRDEIRTQDSCKFTDKSIC